MLSPQDRALARLAVEKRIVPREAMEAALREAEPPDPRDPWSILRARGLLKESDLATLRALTPFASARQTTNATLPTPGPRSASGRPTPRPAPPAAPTYLFGGKYELLDELDIGGMGVVFRAMDLRLKRNVALKLVDLGPRPSPEMVERFEREARMTARLRHPAIVPVHDFGEFNGRHFLVMDFVEGKTLGERIAKGDLPLRDAVEVVRQVAEGVAHAHAEGVIHRDLKPDNVLVSKEGKGFVTDFGLAKETGKPGVRSGLTKTGMAIGTAVYMSPEAAEGDIRAFGPRTDVYGLGAVLYEVLTGRPPFSGESIVSILATVMTQDPERPTRLRPEVPRELEVICLRAMEKEPSRRYASAQAVADDLARWLAGTPIHARPMGAVTKIMRRVRRGRSWLAGVAILLAVSAGALGAVLWKYRAERLRRQEAAEFFQQGLGRCQTLGGLREAIAFLDKAIASRPDYQEAFFQRGVAKLQLGDSAGATDDLERAVAIDPRSADTWYHLGRAACEVPNRRKRSREAFERLLEIDPSYRLAPLARARLAWLEGDLVAAARLCDDAEKAIGSDEEIHFLRGSIAADRGDSRAAIDHYSRGLQVRAESWKCLVNRAKEHMGLAEFDRALADLDRAVQLNPGGVEAWANRAFCLLDLGRAKEAEEALARFEALPPSPQIPAGLVRAKMLTGQGKWKEALEAIQPVLDAAPFDVRALKVRARCEQGLGRLPDAIAAMEKAVEASPHLADLRCFHAELLLAARRRNEAVKELDAVLARTPDCAPALLLRARARLAAADRAGARSDLEAAAKAAPSDHEVALLLGQAYIDDGATEEARKLFEAILDRLPGDPDATMALGLMEIAGGRLRPGCRRLLDGCKAAPGNAAIRANLGAMIAQVGARGLAIAYFDRALALDSACALALQNRGSVRFELHDYEGAVKDFERAAALSEEPALALAGIAEALLAQGRTVAAVAKAEEAVKAGPADDYARVVRAVARAAAGDLKGAAEDAEALLARPGPDPRLYLVRAEARIAQGKAQPAIEDVFAFAGALRDGNGVIVPSGTEVRPADAERLEKALEAMRGDAEVGGTVRTAIGALQIACGRCTKALDVLLEARAMLPEDHGTAELLAQALAVAGSFEESLRLLEATAKVETDPEEVKVVQLWIENLAPLRAAPTTVDERLKRIDPLVFWDCFEQVALECEQGIAEIERRPSGAGIDQVALGRFHEAHTIASLVLATRSHDLKEHQALWLVASAHLKKAIELGGIKPADIAEDDVLQLLLLDLKDPR